MRRYSRTGGVRRVKAIKLTVVGGKPIWLNAKHIVSFWEDEGYTCISTLEPIKEAVQPYIVVTETPEEIFKLL